MEGGLILKIRKKSYGKIVNNKNNFLIFAKNKKNTLVSKTSFIKLKILCKESSNKKHKKTDFY